MKLTEEKIVRMRDLTLEWMKVFESKSRIHMLLQLSRRGMESRKLQMWKVGVLGEIT